MASFRRLSVYRNDAVPQLGKLRPAGPAREVRWVGPSVYLFRARDGFGKFRSIGNSPLGCDAAGLPGRRGRGPGIRAEWSRSTCPWRINTVESFQRNVTLLHPREATIRQSQPQQSVFGKNIRPKCCDRQTPNRAAIAGLHHGGSWPIIFTPLDMDFAKCEDPSCGSLAGRQLEKRPPSTPNGERL